MFKFEERKPIKEVLSQNELAARIQYFHDLLQTYHNELTVNEKYDEEEQKVIQNKIDHNTELLSQFCSIFESIIYTGPL